MDPENDVPMTEPNDEEFSTTLTIKEIKDELKRYMVGHISAELRNYDELYSQLNLESILDEDDDEELNEKLIDRDTDEDKELFGRIKVARSQLELWNDIINARDNGEELPADLDIDMEKCHLSALPSTLFQMKGLIKEVNISNNRLPFLPPEIGALKNVEDLNVENNILSTLPAEIINCRKLQSIKIIGNPINSFPNNLDGWSNAEIEGIDLNHLTGDIVQELQRIHRRQEGPSIEVLGIQEQMPESIEEDINLARPIDQAASRWLRLDNPERNEIIAHFKQTQSECDEPVQKAELAVANTNDPAERLTARSELEKAKERKLSLAAYSRLLDRLDKTADYRNPNTRPGFESRVVDLIRSAYKDPDSLNVQKHEAEKALGSCGDRVANAFDDVETAHSVYVGIRDNWPLERRLAFIKGEFDGIHIEWEARRRVATMSPQPDEIEHIAGYKLALAKERGVPHVMASINFPAWAKVEPKDIDSMRDYLNGLNKQLLAEYTACRGDETMAYLAGRSANLPEYDAHDDISRRSHGLWQDWLQKNHAEELKSIDDAFTKLQEAIEDPWEFGTEAPKDTPQEFKQLIDNIITQGEWIDAQKEITNARDQALLKFSINRAKKTWMAEEKRQEKADKGKGKQRAIAEEEISHAFAEHSLASISETAVPDKSPITMLLSNNESRQNFLTNFVETHVTAAARMIQSSTATSTNSREASPPVVTERRLTRSALKRDHSQFTQDELGSITQDFVNHPTSWESALAALTYQIHVKVLHKTLSEDGTDMESAVVRLRHKATGPYSSKVCKLVGKDIDDKTKLKLFNARPGDELILTPELPDKHQAKKRRIGSGG